jgi:alkylated DNA repair dioxygenase AlkB
VFIFTPFLCILKIKYMFSEQLNLFQKSLRNELEIKENGLDLLYYESFISPKLATYYFNELKKRIEWKRGVIWIYDKIYESPRLSSWHGDFESHAELLVEDIPLSPWNPILDTLKTQLSFQLNLEFNAAFLNFYRDENDSVAWHSDKEKISGKNPTIVLLSLGEERIFQMRHKYNKKIKSKTFHLKNGSVLIMRGTSQTYWQHTLPKLNYPCKERMSVTFRNILLNDKN